METAENMEKNGRIDDEELENVTGGAGSPPSLPYTAYVYSPNGKDINLHKGPGKGYSSVCRLSLGTAVTVLDWTTRTWYRVEVNGNSGYIQSEYLTTESIW